MAEGKAASRAARRERGSLVFIKGSRGMKRMFEKSE
jgi:hypothetical protein